MKPCAALAVLALCASAGVRPARADDAADEAAFEAATRKLADGDLTGARADFEALARTAPTGRWADDALAEAASAAEKQGDLAGARGLWKRVVDEFPDSRVARRAGVRLAALIEAGGADGHWDRVAAEHQRLMAAAAGAEDPHASLTALGQLLDGSAGYPKWFAAALWLGQAWARIGELGRARQWLARAAQAAGSDEERFRAGFARGDLAADAGDYDDAERQYRALRPPDELAAGAVREALSDLRWRRRQFQIGIAARVALVLCALAGLLALRWRAGSWRAGLRRLWPPPLEVIYLAPVAALLIALAETGNLLAARATEMILGGGLAITWLAGAVIAAVPGRPSRATLVIHIGAVAIAVVSLCWVAVVREQLIDLLIETWRRGHDLR